MLYDIRGKIQNQTVLNLNIDKINNYFSEVGKKLVNNININDYDNFCYTDYLKPPNIHSFSMHETNPHEIISTVQGMQAKTSSGCDNISSKLLHKIIDTIAEPLSFIFNKSFT